MLQGTGILRSNRTPRPILQQLWIVQGQYWAGSPQTCCNNCETQSWELLPCVEPSAAAEPLGRVQLLALQLYLQEP